MGMGHGSPLRDEVMKWNQTKTEMPPTTNALLVMQVEALLHAALASGERH